MKRNVLLAVVFSLLLVACGASKVHGTYKGVMTLTFKPEGVVSILVMGVLTDAPYAVEGDKIRFHVPGGENLVLTKLPDGSLDGGVLGKFLKQ